MGRFPSIPSSKGAVFCMSFLRLDSMILDDEMLAAFRSDGAVTAPQLFPREMFSDFYSEVLTIAGMIAPDAVEEADGSIDKAWMGLARRDRKMAGTLYDAVKHSMALRRFAMSPPLVEAVSTALGDTALALVDLNFRIDAPSEPQFLFSWHQDYWFSMCSPKALVAWIPMMPLDEEVGGIEYFPLSATGGRILSAKRAPEYRSYSDSILLNEPIPNGKPRRPLISWGDALLFSFDVLHRSLPNRALDRCRWTVQLRFVAYSDDAFLKERYRPGLVTKEHITYLERMEGQRQ